MALASCTGTIAKSFAEPCANPLDGGYSGRAVIFDARDITLTRETNNPRLVSAITIASGKTPFAVINGGDQPFTGSSTQSTTENGSREYTKTVVFLDPKRGAAASADVEALAALPLGFVVIAEKMQRTSDGGFEIIGGSRGLKVNGDGIVRDEYANGGAIQITASTRERYLDVVYNDGGDYDVLLTDFEAWLATAPAQ